MNKKDRIVRVTIEFSEDALYRRIKAALKRVRRLITIGPPFHTFVDLTEQMRRSERARLVSELEDFASPRIRTACLWCNREERWWRMYEKCTFQVTRPKFGMPNAKTEIAVEHTEQVGRV